MHHSGAGHEPTQVRPAASEQAKAGAGEHFLHASGKDRDLIPPGKHQVFARGWYPDERYLVIGDKPGTVHIYDVENSRAVRACERLPHLALPAPSENVEGLVAVADQPGAARLIH